MAPFRWNDWNIEHCQKHGCTPEECEAVVRAARKPFPQARGDGKWLVEGRGTGGRFVRVIYVVGLDDRLYVIHARPLNDREKRRYRRRRE